MLDQGKLQQASEAYQRSSGPKASYGTSGFRDKGNTMHSTLFRCGVLIALRSKQLGKVTGLMVTASHNPAEDNGVKLVEPSGHMLQETWEPLAERLVNANSSAELCQEVSAVISQQRIQSEGGTVFIGHDSRETSESLAEAACRGVESVGAKFELRGLLTTPLLHWMVREHNAGRPDTEADYFRVLASAYDELSGLSDASPEGPSEDTYGKLSVDCANGVGAPKLAEMQKHLKQLQLRLANTGAGVLNENCGADFVQKGTTGQPTLPQGFADSSPTDRCASFDGDADRIVFFRNPEHEGIELFDGDRIAVLFASLVQKLIAKLPKETQPSVAVVQTAYANGNSTAYIGEKLGLQALLAKTGVKHLHGLAERYQIGIYFEANGHGTILFQEEFVQFLGKSAESAACQKLLAISRLVNQATGDAISNLLLVDAALRMLGWDMNKWATLYKDLPSSMLKVKVPDRTKFTTNDSETRTLTPANVQPCLDSIVEKFPYGRCFVRPSGTEDVVRVYAEASTRKGAMELAQLAADIVVKEA